MKNHNIYKKLTQKERDLMWGESGPYSQVRLCEETRILDDRVSRVFLVVEAEINPFTFEFVQKHREEFANDKTVIQLLDHAEYCGDFGYVASAGEVKLGDEGAEQFARQQADMTIQTLIRMHKFVIDAYGISSNNDFGVVKNEMLYDNPLVWNTEMGRIEPAQKDELWDEHTLIKSPSGIRDSKIRFFIVFALEKDFDFKKESVILFAKILKKTANDFKVEIEDCESFVEYMLITALLPYDIAPADFAIRALDGCVTKKKKPMFKKDYLITNVKEPTPEQIMMFLTQ